MITLENVTKTYSGETTIGPINVEIPSGGITSLVGPNGAGKSTVLTMMTIKNTSPPISSTMMLSLIHI